VLWRWRGSTVAAVAVLLLWYFFSSLSLPVLPRFFDGFPFSFKRIVSSLGLLSFSFLPSSF
jgi:hypothetical protein